MTISGHIWRAELGIPQGAPVAATPPSSVRQGGISKSAATRVCNTIRAQYGDMVKDVAYGYLFGDYSGISVEVTLTNGNRLIGHSGRHIRRLLALTREQWRAANRAAFEQDKATRE